mgnify:CR=1 FL=1
MVSLNELKPNKVNPSKKRVGRGGSRGKTSGRGHKGQKQHGGHGIRPEMRDIIKKLPKLRGYGKNRARTVNDSRVVYMPINLDVLEKNFENGDTVSPATLYEKKLVGRKSGKILPVKILGRGKLTKKLTVEDCEMSEAAKKAIS